MEIKGLSIYELDTIRSFLEAVCKDIDKKFSHESAIVGNITKIRVVGFDDNFLRLTLERGEKHNGGDSRTEAWESILTLSECTVPLVAILNRSLPLKIKMSYLNWRETAKEEIDHTGDIDENGVMNLVTHTKSRRFKPLEMSEHDWTLSEERSIRH
jgi:hypothetical protein